MKVELISGVRQSSEYNFALKLRDQFIRKFGDKPNDGRFAWIFPNHDCSSQAGVRDVDILVYADIRMAVPTFDGNEEILCFIQNFAVAIELCNRDEWRVDSSSHVWVNYSGDEHNKSSQNLRQTHALKEQIKRASRHTGKSIPIPYFEPVLWMTAARDRFQGDVAQHTLCASQGLEDLIQLIASRGRRTRTRQGENESSYRAWNSGNDQINIRSFLRDVYRIHEQEQKHFGSVTRRQIDAISGDILVKRKAHMEQGLDGLLVMTGDPGTGKTITLLNLAHELLLEQRTALFLTYNIALACDVRQMWWHLKGAKDVPGEFTIKSSFSFFGSLWRTLAMDSPVEEFFDEYETTILPLMHQEVLNYSDDKIKLVRRNRPELFGCGKVLIDEGQDWDQREVEIIERIFGPERLLVAQSMSQLVRNNQPMNWHDWLATGREKNSNLVLRESMRQKQALLDFNRALAEWYSQPIRLSKSRLAGGSIKLITGTYSADVHQELMTRHTKMNATLYEFLFLVPNGYSFERRLMPHRLGILPSDYIDLSSHELRKTFEKDGDLYNQSKYRILNYESSRGLEGWTCVCLELDQFYSSLSSIFVPKTQEGNLRSQQTELTVASSQEQLETFLFNWLLIPLTRAIDTIVLHVKDPDCDLAKALRHALDQSDK